LLFPRSELERLLQSNEHLKPVMAGLHRQYNDICLREATERDLRDDLKTVWDNHSNKRRLDINVKFSLQRPTAPLMLMPPGSADGTAVCAPVPEWTTPNSYFISLPVLPALDRLKRSKSGGSDEPPDDMIDLCTPLPLLIVQTKLQVQLLMLNCRTFSMEIYRDPVIAPDGFT
jgi:hypothetical protein